MEIEALRLAAKSAAPYGTAMIGANHLNEAADTIDTLRAQLAEAQRDAERYRYLRTLDASRDPPADKTMWVVQYRHPAGAIPELVSGGFGESLDASIDAAKGEQ